MTKNKAWLVIINPNAGNKKGQKDWEKISSALNRYKIDFVPVFTEYQQHAIELCKQYINKSFVKIIAVGGDGTLNEIVNSIFLQNKYPVSEITLAAISVGTGNDWGRMYNIPADYVEAVKVIKRGKTFVQDAGVVEYNTRSSEVSGFIREKKYFINAAGLGFGAEVVKKVNQKKALGKKSSQLVYLKDLFSCLFSYKLYRLRITIDDYFIEDNIFTMSVGINKYSGGGMKQLPDAIPDDGLFDITIIKHIRKFEVIKNVHRLYNGTIGKHKRVETLTGKKVNIESDSKVLLESDGESLGFPPYSFEIIPKSLRIVIGENFHK